MEHLLKSIVEIEKEAKAIVAETDALETNEEEISSADIIAEAQKRARFQIESFAQKQKEYLEKESAAIDRQSEKVLSQLNTAFEQNKEKWVDTLYRIAVSEE